MVFNRTPLGATRRRLLGLACVLIYVCFGADLPIDLLPPNGGSGSNSGAPGRWRKWPLSGQSRRRVAKVRFVRLGARSRSSAPGGFRASRFEIEVMLHHFTPEMQQGLDRASGTLDLSQHFALGA